MIRFSVGCFINFGILEADRQNNLHKILRIIKFVRITRCYFLKMSWNTILAFKFEVFYITFLHKMFSFFAQVISQYFVSYKVWTHPESAFPDEILKKCNTEYQRVVECPRYVWLTYYSALKITQIYWNLQSSLMKHGFLDIPWTPSCNACYDITSDSLNITTTTTTKTMHLSFDSYGIVMCYPDTIRTRINQHITLFEKWWAARYSCLQMNGFWTTAASMHVKLCVAGKLFV